MFRAPLLGLEPEVQRSAPLLRTAGGPGHQREVRRLGPDETHQKGDEDVPDLESIAWFCLGLGWAYIG